LEDFVRWYSPRDWIPCEASHDDFKASNDQSCSEDTNNNDSNIATDSNTTTNINPTKNVVTNNNTTSDVTNNSNNTSGWDEVEETSSQVVVSGATSVTTRVLLHCIV